MATVVLAEGSVQLLVRTGVLATPRPSGAPNRFWDGSHARFGVWHRPGASFRHETSCFGVTYRANSVGARERDETSDRPRVVVLGDSFVEGWGLPVGRRISDRLEASTGLEHLNLGMAHFGPYQASLAYAEVGSRFRHDLVLVGVVPINDFINLDYEAGRESPAYLYRYRPYLVGEYPDYRVVDHREGRVAAFLRRHSYTYQALDSATHSLRAGGDVARTEDSVDERGRHRSYYHDFSERQLDLLRYSLERIVDEAGTRPVVVFLIPARPDFLRFQQQGPGPLGERLAAWGRERGVRVVDLLPAMAAREPDGGHYFFPCDYHWNGRANAVAAQILEDELREHFYVPAKRSR